MSESSAKSALRVVQESFPWVLQRKAKKSAVWQDVGRPIQGRSKAYALLNEQKAKAKDNIEFRVIPKNEADKYREGLNTARERKRTRRPLLALPETI